MRIGGLLKFSLIDYPGKVAAVIFTQGCNYRCPFCHNPELVLPESFLEAIPEADIFDFLSRRQGQLEGIVVTGGEPTLHADLLDFLRKIKALGFLVKLDTNGSRPDVLRQLFDEKLVDHLAMDIKSSLQGYNKATGVVADAEAVKRSIEIIKSSGVEYQFRTTVLKKLVTREDIKRILDLIGEGANYKLQKGNMKAKVLDFNYFADEADYTDEEFDKMKRFYSNADKVRGGTS